MKVRRGIAVSPGVAIGPALVLDTEGVRITKRTVPAEQVPEEIATLRAALGVAAKDARETRRLMAARVGQDVGNIFGAQETAFEDDSFRIRIERLIESQKYSAEYAVSRSVREYVNRFEAAAAKMGERAGIELRRRAVELIDLEKQLLAILLGHDQPLLSITSSASRSSTILPRAIFKGVMTSGSRARRSTEAAPLALGSSCGRRFPIRSRLTSHCASMAR